MKNRVTRLLTLALCLVLIAFVCPDAANAFAPVDLTKAMSLTIFANDEEQPLAGVGFDLYRVADMDADSRFVLLDAYAAFEGDINELETAQQWQEASAWMQAAAAGKTPDLSGTSGEDGLVRFDAMKPGLYLVSGKPVEILPWAYTFSPFIVSIPTRNADDEWVYDVFSDIKLEKTPAITSIDVVKIWNDEGHEDDRPNELYVDLYCDGVQIDVAHLHAGNSWSHTFTNLPAAHEYTVKERIVPKWYEVSYETINGVLVIRNKHTNPGTPVPDIPATGQLWWPVPILAGAGMILFILGWAMHRKWSQEHE